MPMDKQCYEQLRNDTQARIQLWFEVVSEVESHKDWHTIDVKTQEIVRRILRYVMVEGWND